MAKNTKNRKNKSSKDQETVNNSKMHNNLLLRAIAIIVGIFIVLVPTFLFTNSNYSLILLLIGGIVTSLIAKGKSEDGAINGFIMGFIAALLLLIFKGNYLYIDSPGIISNIWTFFSEMGGAILILALFGLLGGIIGVLIRDLLIKNEKS